MAGFKAAKVPDQSTIYSDSNDLSTGAPDLRLLHYNDVYHIEAGSQEPVGGAARFQTLCKYYRENEEFRDQSELIELFSGDAFNPSLESSVTKGEFASSKSGLVTVAAPSVKNCHPSNS